MASFEMEIKEIFHLSGGRTALVGPISGYPKDIFNSKCEIRVDGTFLQLLLVEGIMLVAGISLSNDATKNRAISTLDKVLLDSEDVRNKVCILRKVDFREDSSE
jgi:hypothetical protein